MINKITSLVRNTFNQEPLNIIKLSADGSSRQYFRIITKDKSIIGTFNENLQENIAFIDYAKQLKSNGINVPEIYSADLNNNIYLQKDLGDETLFSFGKTHSFQQTLPFYKKALTSLIKIQNIKNFNFKNAYPTPEFNRESIMWDLNYFKYYFVKLADIQFNEKSLEDDFNTLCDYTQNCNQNFFLYRDFIQRNIMVYDNDVYFIDFQGGRKGALQYDLASFIYNSKTDLNNEQRHILLDFYINELKKVCDINTEEFMKYFHIYSYIRIMQTFGAYGYRGFFQKKTQFLKSIPFAVKNLEYLENNVSLDINLNELHRIFNEILNSGKIKKLADSSNLTITIRSFSYKDGIPYDKSGNGGGFVFDCRALPNPGREDKFKHLTGLDKEVKEYLENQYSVQDFFANAINLINQTINNYKQRNFTDLNISFGCTGGQHRSVFMAQKCADILSQDIDLKIIIKHIKQNI